MAVVLVRNWASPNQARHTAAALGFFSPSLFLVKITLKTSEIHYLREPRTLRILRQKKVSQEVMEQLFKVYGQISLSVQLMGSYPYARSALEIVGSY